MNTFYITTDSSGYPIEWGAFSEPEPIQIDFIKRFTGKELKGMTSKLWDKLGLRCEVIGRIKA
jgi:hypothetical protein